MHQQRTIVRQSHSLCIDSPSVGVFPQARQVTRVLSFLLNPKRHNDVSVIDRLVDVSCQFQATESSLITKRQA
jgi:stage III sporulation protein SpoIIIAA